MTLDIHTQQLYQQVILEHNRTPHNFRRLDDFTHHSEGYNPLCGDHIEVFMRVVELASDKKSPRAPRVDEQTIETISFTGQSCAICKASASMMSVSLQGRATAVAKNNMQLFQKLLQGENITRDELGKLLVFATIWRYPARVKCAALPWYTMRGALEASPRVSTEQENQP